jgi:hypothetical protein
MDTTQVQIEDAVGNPIPNTRAIVWGNNAAWLCPACNNLLGNRTGDTEYQVACTCGTEFEIRRGANKNGSLNLGPALGVRQV